MKGRKSKRRKRTLKRRRQLEARKRRTAEKVADILTKKVKPPVDFLDNHIHTVRDSFKMTENGMISAAEFDL